MKTVTVVGAGFAGLTLAYYLKREGFQVLVVEKQGRTGGLVGTVQTEFGPVETGPNALLSNRSIETLFEELGVPFAERLKSRRRRYIFDGDQPSRWPLDLNDSVKLAWRALRLFLGDRALRPAARESIASWGDRFGGELFTDRVLAPGLQGIYAGDPKLLSAVLILKNMFTRQNRRGRFKGSVAPERGMGQLMRALTKRLAKDGVRITYEERFAMPEFITNPLVLTVPAWTAADLLKTSHPRVAETLGRCQSLALVSQTAFFAPRESDPRGFGCLFPRVDKFHHLGVLFNSDVFAGRGGEGATPWRSETWIRGGAGFEDVTAIDDERLLTDLLTDRRRLTGGAEERPVHVHVSRWPRAIPHYTTEWERALDHLDVPPPLYLHGNYLGQLGLTRVHTRSRQLARLIRNNHG